MDQYAQEICQEVQETSLGIQETHNQSYQTQRRTPLTQKIYELTFVKISIFRSKMVQETIKYAQETCQECQETCHRVHESSLGYNFMQQQLLEQPNMPNIQSLGLYCIITNSDFLEFQETLTLSCTRFLASQEAENSCADSPYRDLQESKRASCWDQPFGQEVSRSEGCLVTRRALFSTLFPEQGTKEMGRLRQRQQRQRQP